MPDIPWLCPRIIICTETCRSCQLYNHQNFQFCSENLTTKRKSISTWALQNRAFRSPDKRVSWGMVDWSLKEIQGSSGLIWTRIDKTFEYFIFYFPWFKIESKTFCRPNVEFRKLLCERDMGSLRFRYTGHPPSFVSMDCAMKSRLLQTDFSPRMHSGALIRILGIAKIQADDYLLMYATIWYTLLVVSINKMIFGGGSNFMTSEEEAALTTETVRERIIGSKWVFVSEQAMILTLWSLKLCMLFIYRRMTWVSPNTVWKGYSTAGWLQCHLPEKAWSKGNWSTCSSPGLPVASLAPSFVCSWHAVLLHNIGRCPRLMVRFNDLNTNFGRWVSF